MAQTSTRREISPDSAEVTPFDGADPQEWYFSHGYTDGLPIVPPTPEKLDAMVEALGGDSAFLEARVPPRWGNLTRQVLAVNAVMAGCLPIYAPVLRTAMRAMCESHFNLNAIQSTTQVIAPLAIVNGPVRAEIGMNSGHGAFGPGNRANATIGRAIRLILLNVGGALPGVLGRQGHRAVAAGAGVVVHDRGHG